MKDKNLKIEFNERALFNMMHSVRIAIDKPVIQFHYQIEDIEKIVVKIGAAKEILTTVAKGKFLNAINIAIKAINPNKHLKKCPKGNIKDNKGSAEQKSEKSKDKKKNKNVEMKNKKH